MEGAQNGLGTYLFGLDGLPGLPPRHLMHSRLLGKLAKFFNRSGLPQQVEMMTDLPSLFH